MASSLVRYALILIGFWLAPVLGGWVQLTDSGHALAQADESESESTTRKTPAMRERVYERLSEAQALAEGDDFEGALEIIGKLQEMRDLNSYELAQMWSFYGFIYFSQEKFKEAIRAYEQVLAQPDLPEALETGTTYTLAQLYFSVEDYVKAIDYINSWFELATNPGPEPYILLGQAYYQLERYREAIPPVERAIAIARERDRKVQENWYLLLRVFYYELEDYPKVIEILEQLVREYPKREYWLQLSALYGETEQEQKQLTAYEVAYMQGFLMRSQELVTLAQLLLQHEVPYRAGVVLGKGLEEEIVEKTAVNYRLLSQAWTLAQEDTKAIEALTRAARLSDEGELDARLAQAYINVHEFEQAAEAARVAIRKGVDDQDEVQVLLGMALYSLERYDEAKSAFRVAQGAGSRTATQWINYITKEQDRLAQLERSLR